MRRIIPQHFLGVALLLSGCHHIPPKPNVNLATNPRLKADARWSIPMASPTPGCHRRTVIGARIGATTATGRSVSRPEPELGTQLRTRQRLVAHYQQRHLSGNRAFQRAGNGGDTGFRQLLAQPENHADLP